MTRPVFLIPRLLSNEHRWYTRLPQIASLATSRRLRSSALVFSTGASSVGPPKSGPGRVFLGALTVSFTLMPLHLMTMRGLSPRTPADASARACAGPGFQAQSTSGVCICSSISSTVRPPFCFGSLNSAQS
jgi:hypothetical protein